MKQIIIPVIVCLLNTYVKAENIIFKEGPKKELINFEFVKNLEPQKTYLLLQNENHYWLIKKDDYKKFNHKYTSRSAWKLSEKMQPNIKYVFKLINDQDEKIMFYIIREDEIKKV